MNYEKFYILKLLEQKAISVDEATQLLYAIGFSNNKNSFIKLDEINKSLLNFSKKVKKRLTENSGEEIKKIKELANDFFYKTGDFLGGILNIIKNNVEQSKNYYKTNNKNTSKEEDNLIYEINLNKLNQSIFDKLKNFDIDNLEN